MIIPHVKMVILLMLTCSMGACQANKDNKPVQTGRVLEADDVIPGIMRYKEYADLVNGKRVGVIVNKASRAGEDHTVDFLLDHGVNVVRIFAPEHGFRSDADRGAQIEDEVDTETGLPIISLYGANKKLKSEMVRDIDVMIFDLQDVGARFYTYISTMHYAMEGCAKSDVTFIVADRPNPNGFYVDGPILQMEYQSFVGMHPIPIVHGLTVGELAQMITGEQWLSTNKRLDLHVVPCVGYTHADTYRLPVKPSPNLPNLRSVLLYPSLCLFEGTTASVGRGTDQQFQVIGHPDYPDTGFYFIPIPGAGAMHPVHEGDRCYGIDLSGLSVEELIEDPEIRLEWLLDFYHEVGNGLLKEDGFLEKLVGNGQFRDDVQAKKTEVEIKRQWETELELYKQLRTKYLLYPDF